MARYLSFRDGGKTDEKGISQHLSGLFTGEVINGLAVAQNSPLAMIVTVSKGRCMIDSGSDYPYLGFTDGTESVNVNTADGSNPRIDTLVAYVDKAVVDSTTSNNPNAFKFKAVAGTPAGSPVAPNSAAISSSIGAGNPYIKLANIAVGAGVTTISNGNITDTRIDTSAVLADDVVTTAKIADSVVTPAKTLYGVASYRMTSNTTYSSFTNQKLGLGTFLTDGTVVFTTSSNGIAIPSGVNYVEVSATISGVVTTTNNYYLRIYKDAVLQREAYARFSASTNGGVALTPFLLSVSSGEVIYLYLGADSSSTFRADIGTALTVKYVS